ncbi:MAG: hypothetical protein JSS09_09565, partial [Verrucomicrobia bacterium]|nr:hypothetical protein [Verrucomicrobiota bacterium]
MNVTTSVVVFVKPSDLNDGTTPADRFSPGEKAIYRGPPQPIYYGLSNPFKVNLEPGHTVVICKNQFTNRRDYDPSGKKKGSFILHAHV